MRRSPAPFLLVLLFVLSACAGSIGVDAELRDHGRAPVTTIASTNSTIDPRQQIVVSPNPVAVPRSAAAAPQAVEPTVPVTTTTAPVTTTTTTAVEAVPSVLPNTVGVQPPPVPAITIGIVPPAGTVALTFVDGPFVGWTESILQVLDDLDVTATFFVSTYLLPGNEHLIPLILEAGHSVQTHGDQHDILTAKSADEIRADLQASIDKLVAAGAPRPICFRPPHGMTDLVVESVAAELGLTVIGWDLNSLDYSLQEPGGVIATVLDQARDGSVVLMHDQWAPIHDVTLRTIVPELRARGLDFSPLCTTGPIDG